MSGPYRHPDPFEGPVGAVIHLVTVPLLPLPGGHGLPPLYRATVTGRYGSVDEVWVPERARWESTTALVPHRSGRADGDVEAITLEDAQRLIAAHALRLAQEGSG